MRVSYESAWAVVGALGNMNAVEIEDSNSSVSSMNRPFINYVKRCTTMQERLSFAWDLLQKSGNPPVRVDEYDHIFSGLGETHELTEKTGDTYFDNLEGKVNEVYDGLKRNSTTFDQLSQKLYDLVEQKRVYSIVGEILPKNFGIYFNANQAQDEETPKSINCCYICGVLNSSDVERFQKLVFRVSRGNSFLKLLNIPEEKDEQGNCLYADFDENHNPIAKTVFFLAFQTGVSDVLRSKLMRVCDAFGVRRYNLPKTTDEISKEVTGIDNEIINFLKIKETTQGQIDTLLLELSKRKGDSPCSLIDELQLKVLREKCVYETFDKMKMRDKIFYGRMWIPEYLEENLLRVIDGFVKTFNFSPPELEKKDWEKLQKTAPTHFKTNCVTKPFLEIVETYGIPRYREANPAPWAVATFPYEFGVMFGDIGHGGLLFVAGSCLVYYFDKLKAAKVPKKLLELRFLLFFMGFFAFYCGFIYNEFFAIPMKYFSPCYDTDTLESKNCTYPIGLDPAWYLSKNEVTFFNSFKMKLSIIVGVLHMMLGIFIRGANNIHFRQPIDFVFECLPQIIFMSCTFGYMCIAIIIKWITDWSGRTPPAILTIFTSLGLTVN